MAGNAPWLDNTIGSWIGGILVAATIGICLWLYNSFSDLIGLAVAHAGFWGWGIVASASLIASMLGWLFFDRQRLLRLRAQNAIELKPAACLASFIYPSNHALVTAGWISVEGTSTGAPQHYWLLNHKTGQYWPHGPIGVNHDGSWKVDIYLSSAPAAREVEVTLAWVTEEVHSFLENWKTKCKETNNWNGLKVKFPRGHFVPLETRTFAVIPVPQKATVSITSVALEHVVTRGTTVAIDYEIQVTGEPAKDVWLGASFQDASGRYFYNTNEDKTVVLAPGKKTHRRSFSIAKDATLGEQRLRTNLWSGVVGDSRKSTHLASGSEIKIRIVEYRPDHSFLTHSPCAFSQAICLISFTPICRGFQLEIVNQGRTRKVHRMDRVGEFLACGKGLTVT